MQEFPITVITEAMHSQLNISSVLTDIQQHGVNHPRIQHTQNGLEGLVEIPIAVPERIGVLKENNSKKVLESTKRVRNLGKMLRKKWSRRVGKENIGVEPGY